MPKDPLRPDLLVGPEALAADLDRPGLRILDVRWRPDGSGRRAWEAGHVPGAVHLDWTARLVAGVDDAGIARLAPADLVAEALSEAGVGTGSPVVVYDDSASLYAARVWWSLRVNGLRFVRILDGGFEAWRAAGLPITGDQPTVPPATFVPEQDRPERVTWSDVRALVRDPAVTFVDARPPAGGRTANGRGLEHLARAVSIPAVATTVPATGRFRPSGELAALFAKVRVEPGRRLVCYDGSGVGAAKVAFAASLLGHEDVAVYDGGWAEWGERSEDEPE